MSRLINSALDELSFLPGTWHMELSNASFLSGTNQVAKMETQFEVIENGAFIAMRQGTDATWVIGRDSDKKEYKILYFDSRNVSRVYEMSFESNTWKIWRNTPKFSQRYEAKISDDQKTISAFWEKSFDNGKTWERDFDMKFTKA